MLEGLGLGIQGSGLGLLALGFGVNGLCLWFRAWGVVLRA